MCDAKTPGCRRQLAEFENYRRTAFGLAPTATTEA